MDFQTVAIPNFAQQFNKAPTISLAQEDPSARVAADLSRETSTPHGLAIRTY